MSFSRVRDQRLEQERATKARSQVMDQRPFYKGKADTLTRTALGSEYHVTMCVFLPKKKMADQIAHGEEL